MTKLNDEQRAAVEHGEGPLLVVAGAGTGKTRVIIERIGHLLTHVRGLQPENILALTYARKAAEEMRQRAAERFGPPALRSRVSTFHAFCYELLSETAPRRTLDRVDQWIFLRRNLELLELEHYLRVSEPGRFLDDLIEFCHRCHDNLVSPADFRAYVEKRMAECREAARSSPLPGPTAKASRRQSRPDSQDCSEEEMARLQELAHVYERSEGLQERSQLVSFGAMISSAVALLDRSPELLQQLRRRYRFILVDEFQDTNPAQFELLVRLTGEHRNLTVVGDDDQAIYRFRGASYASFRQFEEHFPEHRRVILSRNYRSTGRILGVAGDAIAFNSRDRYQPDKQLVASYPEGRHVEVWEFADEVQEAEWTATEIARRVRGGEAGSYSNFAVLYRAHRHRDLLVKALERYGIPFAIRKLAVNRLPPVRDLVAYLRAIGRPDDSISLARVLADPRWELESDLLLQYCRRAAGQKQPLREALESAEPPQPWPARERLLDLLNRCRTLAQEQRLGSWLALLAHELGLYNHPGSGPAVGAFVSFVLRWDQEKSATGLLPEFLEYFAYFEEAGGLVAFPDEDEAWLAPPLEPSDRLGIASSDARQGVLWADPGGSVGRVELMTVHGAKGLEFEHVYVLRLLRGAFPTRKQEPLISLPAALWKGPLPQGDFHQEEERRLFYVALTRARSTLTLCTISNERQKPSPFLKQLTEASNPHLEWKRPAAAAPPVPDSGRDTEPSGRLRFSQIGPWAAAATRRSGDGFSLSASQLETYLQCPLKYQFSYGWRVPVPPAPPLLFGSVMHGAVKEVVRALAQRPGNLSPDALQAILNRHWPASGFADTLQDRKYREEGLRQLEGVRQIWSEGPSELLYQEKSFELEWGGTTLVGRMDQINRSAPAEVELIEYKTGRPQTQKDADNSTQLTLYAEACRRVLGLVPRSLVLFNLATGERVRTARTPEQFQTLEQTIRQTAAAIRAGTFPPRPGFLCRYCDFRPICPAHEETW
ncbi:MAG: hypothetical protein A3H28_08280 [Acidobacteria bacterium RIFCSPLOWO2_02_FULL_61_28]|nr:MAG: hypothetical protein A3H28_08280 [Acidobacteria bacterium RIFCSPLOWO2_02_FULL_61_28]